MSKYIHDRDALAGQLPLLTFPDLSETCGSFIDWADPFLNGTELAEANRQVKDFLSPDGRGRRLQHALEETLAQDPSFLTYIPYWNNWYLEQNNPLGLHTNPYYLLDMPPANFLERAADLVCSALSFCFSVADGTLEPDQFEARPLCMKQYSSIFGAVRIPEEGPDRFIRHAKPCGRECLPRHIVVLAKGKIFSLEVLDEKRRPYDKRAIEESLRSLMTSSAETPRVHPGIFTTLGRSEWARIRKEILRAHKENRRALETVEGALFVLCLDDYAPVDPTEAGRILLCGKNRWYDKALQIIVFGDSQAGINFEHSHLDGLPMTRLARYLAKNEPKQNETSHGVPVFREISPMLTTRLREKMKKTAMRLDHEVSNLGTSLLELSAGKSDIKKFGVSPDAFVQLAILLAGHRHRDLWISVSEAVMLRLFDGGRTGVMRTLTPEVLSFVTLMNTSLATRNTRVEALKKASAAHSRRIKKCLKGHGPEEHLQALLAIHRHNKTGKDLSLPALFTGKAWNQLQDTFIATSTTPHEGLKLAGWGPLSEEGFGARYMKTDPNVMINLSYWKNSAYDPEGFMETLLTCAKEMVSLFKEVKKKDRSISKKAL